jgi:hypothetical protein
MAMAITKFTAHRRPAQRVARPRMKAMPMANCSHTSNGARSWGMGKPNWPRNATNFAMCSALVMLSQTPQTRNAPTLSRRARKARSVPAARCGSVMRRFIAATLRRPDDG